MHTGRHIFTGPFILLVYASKPKSRYMHICGTILASKVKIGADRGSPLGRLLVAPGGPQETLRGPQEAPRKLPNHVFFNENSSKSLKTAKKSKNNRKNKQNDYNKGLIQKTFFFIFNSSWDHSGRFVQALGLPTPYSRCLWS